VLRGPSWAVVILSVLAVSGSVSETRGEQPLFSLPEDGVLLLRNGRLVQGRISRSAGGYVVEVTNGRMMVPATQVRFQAASRDAAYRRLRQSIPDASPKYRLSLAAWCLTNKLYGQARKEVQSVLKTDPEHSAAKRMLRRIDEMLDPKSEENTKKRTPFSERLAAPDVTALAGLAPEISRTFVARVQPILMNGCALAGCHGPKAENGFQLFRVHLRAGSRRGHSERNLAATLRFVNLDDPLQSPLLTTPRGNHGRRGQAIFRGRGGARQITILREWVKAVAADSRPPNMTRGTPTRRTATPAKRTISSAPKRSGFGVKIPLPRQQLTPAMRAARSRLQKHRITKEMVSPSRTAKQGIRNPQPAIRNRTPVRDPFDPEVFNRQTRSRDGGANSPSSQSPRRTGRYR